MMAKLDDVAKLAGVSVTTVSRVINQYGYLSQKTIDKVYAAMRELNYLPNTAARSLQGKATNLIGLIFPDVSEPFFGEMVQRLENIFFSHGYKVILCNSGVDRQKEREHLRMLLANKVDGIITGTHNADVAGYENSSAPIISFDRSLAAGIPIVSSDNLAGGRLAAETLLAAGAKKLVIITGVNAPGFPTYGRYEGFVDYLAAHSIKPAVHRCLGPTPTLKAMQLQSILRNCEADGYFCTSDPTAIMLMCEAQKLSLRIPDDIKVVGYDATSLVRSLFPTLTTIAQPIEDCAILLADLLRQRIANPQVGLERNYILPVQLLRGTSA
ncbi:MAG: LacI family DNA-binding transcriptional regulator [Deltaproteobacteria bacterium]|nr:LacI family DNA-binding transcriptional regulator [Deltaproteobacteria bacterium]